MSVWGTGGKRPHAEAFLGSTGSPDIRPYGPHHRASPTLHPGFAWDAGHTLDHGKPPPRPATPLRHSCADLLPGRIPTTPHHPLPKEGTDTTREVSTPDSVLSVACRYGNIDPFIHSTTPVGLALGPDSPGDDERGPGTLGHPADGIHTRLSLLMSAFSLPHSPQRFTPLLHPMQDALLPSRTNGCRVFGGVLEPRYIVGAEPLDQ